MMNTALRKRALMTLVATMVLTLLFFGSSKDDGVEAPSMSSNDIRERYTQLMQASKKKDDKSYPYRDNYHIPPLRKFSLNVRPVPYEPWGDKAEIQRTIRYSLQMIKSLRNHPQLQTEDDQAIFEMVDYYQEDRSRMVVGRAPESVAERVRFGYSCSNDRFFRGKHKFPENLFAVVMYHELMHAVDCKRWMKYHGVSDHREMEEIAKDFNICAIEAPAHAATVRFFLAVVDQNLVPHKVPMAKGRSMFLDIEKSWGTLLNGTFCDDLKDMVDL